MTTPIVIAHRGASGERPEHTRSSYTRAIAQGCDFIEPDLVMTRDGRLVCRHESDISETTDVADHAELASRKTTKSIDGRNVTGWFVEDFTLAELKTLRCKERMPRVRPANTTFDGQDDILTFEEALEIARDGGVGIYPELKHPSYLATIGLDSEVAILESLTRFGWNDRSAPVYVQCFEVGPLQRLAARSTVRKVQLMYAGGRPFDRQDLPYNDIITDAGLANLRTYADAIGVEKGMVLPRDKEGRSRAPTDLIARAHAHDVGVHAWTFRAENMFLPLELRSNEDGNAHGDLAAELRMFYDLGVDGVFADFPAVAVSARS